MIVFSYLISLTKVEKVEWSNPAHSSSADLSFSSVMAPFTEFVVREKYPSLNIIRTPKDSEEKKYDHSVFILTVSRRKQKVVVIEDIPNLHQAKQKGEFVNVVETIVYSRATTLGPVVFIVSDNTKQNNTLMRIIPENILNNQAGKVTNGPTFLLVQ